MEEGDLGGRRLSSTIAHGNGYEEGSAAVASKGHFATYMMDRQHSKLLSQEQSEQLFGLPGDQPITLPCDSHIPGAHHCFSSGSVRKM